jgi:hypothetical protein
VIKYLREKCKCARLSVKVIGEEVAAMAAGFQTLRATGGHETRRTQHIRGLGNMETITRTTTRIRKAEQSRT